MSLMQRGPNSWRSKIERGDRQFTRTIKATSRRAALKLEAAFVAEIDENRVGTASAKLTFGAYLDTWLDGLTLRPVTIQGYRSMVRSKIKPALGSLPIRTLSPIDIKRAFAGWATTQFSASSRTQLRNVLSSALRTAEQLELISRNPMSRLRGMLPIGAPPEAVPTSPEKITELLSSDLGHYRPAVVLMISAGLRRGEALGLRWANFDADRGTIRITEQLIRLAGGAVFGPPKSDAGTRTIKLPQEAIDELRAHRIAKREQLFAKGHRLTDDTTVACDGRGQPLQPHVFTSWCQRHGFNAHGLRHAHLSALANSGKVPISAVSKRAGHSTIATTIATYVHAEAADDDMAADVAGGLMR